MPKITLTHAVTGQVWGPFENATVIGRDSRCDLALPGKRISKVHCKLEPAGNGWALVDLESTNGTFIDSERITRARVADGDFVAIGDVPIRLSVTGATTHAAAVPKAIVPVETAAASRASVPPAPAPVAPVAVAKSSLWELATTATPASPAAKPEKKQRTLSITKDKSKLVVAGLVCAIAICIAWSAYCLVGHSLSTPTTPRQLAPIDNDPSV